MDPANTEAYYTHLKRLILEGAPGIDFSDMDYAESTADFLIASLREGKTLAAIRDDLSEILQEESSTALLRWLPKARQEAKAAADSDASAEKSFRPRGGERDAKRPRPSNDDEADASASYGAVAEGAGFSHQFPQHQQQRGGGGGYFRGGARGAPRGAFFPRGARGGYFAPPGARGGYHRGHSVGGHFAPAPRGAPRGGYAGRGGSYHPYAAPEDSSAANQTTWSRARDGTLEERLSMPLATDRPREHVVRVEPEGGVPAAMPHQGYPPARGARGHRGSSFVPRGHRRYHAPANETWVRPGSSATPPALLPSESGEPTAE